MKYCLLFIVAMSAGCFHMMDMSQGNPELTTGFIQISVAKNKTTKEDLLKLLGPPQNTSITADYMPKITSPNMTIEQAPAAKSKQSWTWWSRTRVSETTAGSVVVATSSYSTTRYRFIVFTAYLDDKGVVVDYMINESYQ